MKSFTLQSVGKMLLSRAGRSLASGMFLLGFLQLTFVAAECDMQVRDGPSTLQWKCEALPCTNCGKNGICASSVTGTVIEVHRCDCDDGQGQLAPASCYTILTFDTGTGVVAMKCRNSCCNNDCPPPAGPYPTWTDPCPCP
jgi:hypothetical protein